MIPTIRITVSPRSRTQAVAVAQAIEEYPTRRRAAVDGIVRRGISSNLRILGAGGGMAQAGGGSVEWSHERHPWTKRIRRFVFDDTDHDYQPFLQMTGKLQLRAVAGTTEAGAGQLSYRLPGDIEALAEAHQFGLSPLPDARNSQEHVPRLPPREFMFWSQLMAEEIAADAQGHFNRAVSGGVP